jgi:hypothetical protein
MGRFTDKQIEAMFIDPSLPGHWGTCPTCGGVVVLGYRKTLRTPTLAHSMVESEAGVLEPGCVTFRELAPTDPVGFMKAKGGLKWEGRFPE